MEEKYKLANKKKPLNSDGMNKKNQKTLFILPALKNVLRISKYKNILEENIS